MNSEDWDSWWNKRRNTLSGKFLMWIRLNIYAKTFSKAVRNYIANGYFLEVGCGSSSASLLLENCSREFVGLDFSMKALGISKLNGARNLVRADMYMIPFKEDCFSFVWSIGLIEHLSAEKAEELMKELIRITNSKIVNIIPDTNSLKYKILLWIEGILGIKEKDEEEILEFTDNSKRMSFLSLPYIMMITTK